ncbi:MAG TPA: SPOR domain-containing protein, partial [Gammaproteobacteria bacterium]|nr:SPOR domain-containing protein [Gammaproteobacteria bacterium]
GLGKAWNNMGVVHLRQAVNAYMQLCQHAEPGDRLCERAQQLVDGINVLLTGSPDRPDSVPQPAEAAASTRTRTERAAPEPAREKRLDPEPAPSPPPEPASRSAAQPAPKTDRDETSPAGPAAAAPAPKEPSSVATRPPDAPALRDVEWLAQQAPDAFFVQLSSGFASGPLLRLAQRLDLSGDDHHVFTAANSSGRVYFQLLHGPFTDYDAARVAVEALPPPLEKLDPTIRRAGSLQALRGLEAAGDPSP